MAFCPRMSRLMASDSKAFVLAIDHGFFNFGGGTKGIEDMRTLVPKLAAAGPDAMLLTLGAGGFLQGLIGRERPALIFRTDTSNMWEYPAPDYVFSQTLEDAVDHAVIQDAACVVVNLMHMAGGLSELHHQCLANMAKVKRACQRVGMPMMVEPVPLKRDSKRNVYVADDSLTHVELLVRQAVEMGASIIKSMPTANPHDFHKIVETSMGIPVLALGGGRISDKVLFEKTEVMLDQGAAGIVYGRNVFQHEKPEVMIRALMAMVHEGADARKAAGIIAGK